MHTCFGTVEIESVDGRRETPKWVDAWFVRFCQPAIRASIHCRRRQREAGEEISIPIGFSWSAFDCILVSCQKFLPTLDARVMFTNLSELFNGSMIRINLEKNLKQILAKSFHGQSNSSTFQLKGAPIDFIGQGRAADVKNGSYGAVKLGLVQHRAETLLASVRVQLKEAGAILHGIPVWKTKHTGFSVSVFSKLRTMTAISFVKTNAAPFLSRSVIVGIRLETFGKNLR